MVHLISRIRTMIMLLLWDLLTAAVLLLLLPFAVEDIDQTWVKAAVYVIAVSMILLMLVLKYNMLYKQYGQDDVTKGKNKREFERIANTLLKKKEGRYVLVYANIDRFKLVNEIYGEEVGNTILVEIQQAIDKDLGWDEVSGRIMADNFGILMRFHSIPKLEQRLERISKKLAGLKDEKGNKYGITLYFGVYIVQDDELNVNVMLEHANLARKKISPTYLVPMGIYDEKDKEKLSREKQLEMKMHHALKHGDFIPYLQPKYELKGETVAGAEALIRWIDPEEGMIFPGEFIPLFEKNGFVVDIDLFMFEEVCKMIQAWHKAGQKVVPISVNLSRRHFEIPDFFQYYEEILAKYEIPPKSIEVELTESLFYNDMDILNNLVSQIHKAGLSCSIDDFGSGYSSLNMLKEVKVDALKLDRVFFESGEDDRRGRDIIQSVLQLAQALNLHTISEGVEEREQVEFLKEMNCDMIQGYVFAKPMPVSEFEHLAHEAGG